MFKPAKVGDDGAPTVFTHIDDHVEVTEVGLTMLLTYAINGQWFPFWWTFEGLFSILNYYLAIPLCYDYVAELLQMGVRPSPTWVDFYGGRVTIKVDDNLQNPVPLGTKILIATKVGNEPLVNCGIGSFVDAGKLLFTPVYGDDPRVPGKSGAHPGDPLTIFLLTPGGEKWVEYGPVGSGLSWTWSFTGDNLELLVIERIREEEQTVPRLFTLRPTPETDPSGAGGMRATPEGGASVSTAADQES